MKKMTSKDAKAALALKALNHIKTELSLYLPYLGSALDALPFVADLRTRTMGTDTVFIRFNPTFVIDMFLNRTDILRRTYMQIIIHCIFCHMHRQGLYDDKELFSLCADISAESVVDGMDTEIVYRLSSDYRDRIYEELNANVEILTADRIYKYLNNKKRDFFEEERLKREFSLDDHSFWELPENKNNTMPDSASENKWKKQAERVKNDMANSREPGEATGSMERMLRATFKSHTDYRRLLEKYSIVREEMRIDPDSFDYGLYTYGLDLYGNMPLIEENEHSEIRAVEELVIAIDTSASCQREHVQRFLNETSALLTKTESFFKHTDIIIIECDNKIQKTTSLDNPEKILDYAKGFNVRGGFGTDFRPVFRHIEDMQSAGRLRRLKGLMYFTDGLGVYPEVPTAYETSFVLWKDRAEAEDRVPNWARIVYFTDEPQSV